MPVTARALGALVLALTFVLAACGSTATPAPSPTPNPTPTPPPSAEPSTPPETGAIVVTFRAGGQENFKVRLTDPEDIEIAREIFEGRREPMNINGKVVRGDADVNGPWSWHLDPDDFEFADVTIEVCDGLPSDVEADEITSDRYCTWGPEILDITTAR